MFSELETVGVVDEDILTLRKVGVAEAFLVVQKMTSLWPWRGDGWGGGWL